VPSAHPQASAKKFLNDGAVKNDEKLTSRP
jgi:hypothetical protein